MPRLGGLAYTYLKARLEQWGQGYHSGVGTPMLIVAGGRILNQFMIFNS